MKLCKDSEESTPYFFDTIVFSSLLLTFNSILTHSHIPEATAILQRVLRTPPAGQAPGGIQSGRPGHGFCQHVELTVRIFFLFLLLSLQLAHTDLSSFGPCLSTCQQTCFCLKLTKENDNLRSWHQNSNWHKNRYNKK